MLATPNVSTFSSESFPLSTRQDVSLNGDETRLLTLFGPFRSSWISISRPRGQCLSPTQNLGLVLRFSTRQRLGLYLRPNIGKVSHARARRCRASTRNYVPCHCRIRFRSTRNYVPCHWRVPFRLGVCRALDSFELRIPERLEIPLRPKIPFFREQGFLRGN